MPYEEQAAAYWLLLGPEVELRRTSYDVSATAARVLTSGIPGAADYADGLVNPPGPGEASEFFERMATAG